MGITAIYDGFKFFAFSFIYLRIWENFVVHENVKLLFYKQVMATFLGF